MQGVRRMRFDQAFAAVDSVARLQGLVERGVRTGDRVLLLAAKFAGMGRRLLGGAAGGGRDRARERLVKPG